MSKNQMEGMSIFQWKYESVNTPSSNFNLN